MSVAATTGSESYRQTYGQRPSRGVVGIASLIIAESAIFIIFVVAYIYYIGKSLTGPMPSEVLQLPVLATVCLLSSSLTVHWGVASLRRNQVLRCTLWLATTTLLGLVFLGFTAYEWHDLIVNHHLTIRTNLFGTTFYSLVGLHASHVFVGLLMLSLTTFFGARQKLHSHHAEKVEVLSYYWHFVDAVWVVVFTVVYVLGR